MRGPLRVASRPAGPRLVPWTAVEAGRPCTEAPVPSATIDLMARRRPQHRALAVDSSHWRRDGSPKNRYGSRAEALAAAYDRRAETGLELGAYRCNYCDGWHMGRREGRTDD